MERPFTLFCQQASQRYEELLAEASDDPRSAAGFQALKDGRWSPTLDARDARRTLPEGRNEGRKENK